MTPREALETIKKINVCGYDPTAPEFYYSGTASEIYDEEIEVLENALNELANYKAAVGVYHSDEYLKEIIGE